MAERDSAAVYVSRDLPLPQITCDRIAILRLGIFLEHGPGNEFINNPQHPYTQALTVASIGIRRSSCRRSNLRTSAPA